MCLAIPGRLVAITEGEGFDRRGTVDYDGARQEVALAYLPEAKVGDYVLVHVGFAMTLLDTDEAERILRELRELEAERAAVRARLDFQKSKADWIQERINQGYEGDVEKLWETAQKQNVEAAAIQRLELLLDAQRRQVAHYAGDHWPPLLDYLSGQLKALPED